jgi:hypothetical protein
MADTVRESVRIGPEMVRGVALIRDQIGRVQGRIDTGTPRYEGEIDTLVGHLAGLNEALSLLFQGAVAGR